MSTPVDLTALHDALVGFDEAAAVAELEALRTALSLEAFLGSALNPVMHGIGRAWERGEVNVVQEHFATQVVRAYLGNLARGWGSGDGRVVVLACPPAELHDLPLYSFGLLMHARGWGVRFLGANTPLHGLAAAVRFDPPDLVVLAINDARRMARSTVPIQLLAQEVPVAIAGHGASAAHAAQVGAMHLPGDIVTEARRLAHWSAPSQPAAAAAG